MNEPVILEMTCRLCNIKFPPKKWNITSRDYRCPACKRNQQNEFNRNNPNFKEKYKRAYQDRKEWYKNYYKKKLLDAVFLFKRRARGKLWHAVKSGKIIKPEYCDTCHKRGRIEAHHINYKEPLNVEWKCTICHNKAHHG